VGRRAGMDAVALRKKITASAGNRTQSSSVWLGHYAVVKIPL